MVKADNYSVKEWMSEYPQVLTKDLEIGETLRLLSEGNCSELPVVDHERLIGVVTLGDCLATIKSGIGWNEPIDSIISAVLRSVNEDFPVKQLDGCPTYVVCEKTGMLQGVITQIKLLKINQALFQRLEKSKETIEWYALCFDTAYEGLTIVDEAGVIQLFNENYSRYVGVTKEEAIGLPVENVIENTRIPIVLRTGIPERNQIHWLQGQKMVVHRMPIWKNGRIVGAVGMLIYEGVSEVQQIITQIDSLEQQKGNETSIVVGKVAAPKRFTFEDILGESPAISKTKKLARMAAQSKAPVLITGKSGVGKEQFARAIHDTGKMSSGRFISVNCAAIPENLIESELFGYMEGAFTGAKKGGKPGKFELAHMGTIFLDEIGDMPLATQVKILRVIQEKEVERIGGTEPIQVQFRIITATNKNLERMVREGEFREDLYYRLHVIPLNIPPLRDRKSDIPLIISAQLPTLCQMYESEGKTIDKGVMQQFFRYHWPGNVRELINVLERLFALTSESHIEISDLPNEFLRIEKKQEYMTIPSSLSERNEVRQLVHKEEEKNIIEKVLREVSGNKSEAAKRLGITRATLYNKLSRYQL
ncbi:sigma 54-interacting transcriptional regulator [Sporosarcina sp. E16_8]|uniref:sigma 54-interacting transcriptional regulator n=1 Tax=Sporosarcina sp. E16_8 TaxID=2789295 RepID=UPI001A9190D8|nr:sigma 54-interacting transcriptional regulator [Sporosarcina sp. E16_8]MBO0586261.1 sigma 54-interacting transcriptional regulator [Sporosarcina sp. E16_8]